MVYSDTQNDSDLPSLSFFRIFFPGMLTGVEGSTSENNDWNNSWGHVLLHLCLRKEWASIENNIYAALGYVINADEIALGK